MGSFTGRIAIVTAAAQGIGAALARLVANRGARVAVPGLPRLAGLVVAGAGYLVSGRLTRGTMAPASVRDAVT